MNNRSSEALFKPLELPCGTVLKNRIIKSAMSDSLGDGRGNPTDTQIRLYQRWADGGVAALAEYRSTQPMDFYSANFSHPCLTGVMMNMAVLLMHECDF